MDRHSLGRVGLVYAVTQLEFVRLAPMQGRDENQLVASLCFPSLTEKLQGPQ